MSAQVFSSIYMKKLTKKRESAMENIIKLITAMTLTAAVVACNSGGSGSSNSPAATLTITSVTAPTGSAPAQNLGAGMGTGSVFVNTTTGNPLYLLGNATGSVFAPLTADLSMTTGTSIIGAWLTSANILFGPAPAPSDVAVYFTANLTLPLSTTSNTATWESATLTNVNRTICFGNPQAGANGCAGSNAPTGARLVTSNSGNTQFMFVGYGQPGVSGAESIGYNMLSNNSGLGTPVESEAYVSLASCVASGSGSRDVVGQGATTVSAIATSSFHNNPLFLAGTNSGDVCVGIIRANAEANAFTTASIVNLTAIVKAAGASYTFESSPVTTNSYQATGGYNTLGAVNAIAATPQGSNNTNTIVAWTQGSSAVYEATLTSSASGSYGFANLTDSTKFTNVPSNVSVIYVDYSNNIYVGTFSNQVYVLPNGSTTWLNIAIPNPLTGSQIYNFSAGYNGNVYAYTANGSASAVYLLSF